MATAAHECAERRPHNCITDMIHRLCQSVAALGLCGWPLCVLRAAVQVVRARLLAYAALQLMVITC
jgi:hypothetical protein